jgi:hypothetical protein
MDNEKMKLLNDKLNAFQQEIAKEFGVVLQAGINIVPVQSKIADAVSDGTEKEIADAVTETTAE